MPDHEQISEQDACRLLAAVKAARHVDAETDEQIDADIARLLPPDQAATLHARLRRDGGLAAFYRQCLADLKKRRTPDRVAAAKARVYDRLSNQFPILRPTTSPAPTLTGAAVRLCSEAMREITETFSWIVVRPVWGFTTPPLISKSGDRTATLTTTLRPAGGVRFVVTSRNPDDEGLQLEFSAQPASDWCRTVTLERSLPGVEVWEAVLELTSADMDLLAKDLPRKIHTRPLLS